ncbi:Histone-lysine N-methyltransferase, H3 lysine-9 specific SUVH4 [Hibiscus syriacus]|uniref:Histone-lysine N-methyltransferase, H3 lysine-9 specific SUVH4 n=1 Tax=Hibiscus syriacus TaxID=106335 RepID=A0A6A2WMZ1_HIBSY|nr:Histone-lysine N-methyltransferase, H3 lysine-9 specific SUVH4 [Hibiscus syriacus]
MPFHPTELQFNKKAAKMVERDAKIALGLDGSNASNVAEESAHIKVKKAERLFNNYYLHLVQFYFLIQSFLVVLRMRKKRRGADKVDNKASKGDDADGKAKIKRPDLKAMAKASIDVGHQFYSRAEMVAVGFHSHWLNGTDFMGRFYRKGVHFAHGRVPKCTSEIVGLVCEDISGGQENVPIPATNLVMRNFKSMKVARNLKLPGNAAGCDCERLCRDPNTCSHAKLNGSDFPYVHLGGGRLVEAKHVFECGPNCGCGPECVNRASQGELKYRLEVFHTPKKGWAVRSWDFIPAGAPVCEYIGVLTRTEDLDSVFENNYIFYIDCLQTMRGLGGRADASVSVIQNVDKIDEQRSESMPEFCIDTASIGNVARFINHSCEPNLCIQCVLSAHQDIKLARVVLFAADNIPPLQVISPFYGLYKHH